jgi:hypothetical protein
MSVSDINFVKLMSALRDQHDEEHKDKNRDYCPFCRNIILENTLAELFDNIATDELRNALIVARDVLGIKKIEGEEE